MKIDFYPAGKDCLLIFTGRGGDTKGYGNKYVKIAENVTRKYGFSVFVAAVPENCWDSPQEVFSFAVDYVLSKTDTENIYVTGSSAGASLAIWYSHLYPQIKKVLAVNPVLNLNLHRTKDGILKFNGEKMFIVSGDKDPCVVWLNLLPHKDNLSTQTLKGVDHVFSNRIAEFIALPALLFND